MRASWPAGLPGNAGLRSSYLIESNPQEAAFLNEVICPWAKRNAKVFQQRAKCTQVSGLVTMRAVLRVEKVIGVHSDSFPNWSRGAHDWPLPSSQARALYQRHDWEEPVAVPVAFACSFGRNQGRKEIRNAKSGVKQLELGRCGF